MSVLQLAGPRGAVWAWVRVRGGQGANEQKLDTLRSAATEEG